MNPSDSNDDRTLSIRISAAGDDATGWGGDSGGLQNEVALPSDIGRYRIEGLLGEGGMGRVYKAFDPVLQRTVALKVLKEDHPDLQRRFAREARAQARVEHEHVCRVYEVGSDSGRHYISMQYIAGKTLGDAASEMPVEQRVTVMIQVAEAVHSAHRAGLIHRDLKPSNIMVERDEEGRWNPWVMDFGLAREQATPGITTMGVVLGTVEFMSPEQARGDVLRLDRRCDVYSLGATFYAIMAGQPPLQGKSAVESLMKILNEDPVPLRRLDPSCPPDLETIIMKCLERDPPRRYDSARALAEDLRRYLDGEPIQARPLSVTARLIRHTRKHRYAIGIGGAAIGVALVSLAMGLHARFEASRRTAMAQRFGQELNQVESILRFAHLLPLHDTTRERSLARESITRIESEALKLGPGLRGPALYAMGRGHLALHEYDRARALLDQAWREEKYQDPQVAYALGLALAKVYQHELEAVERLSNKDARAARREEVDRTLRVPAVEFLAKSVGAQAESPEYVEALLALLDRHYDTALSKADTAAKRFPWLYESFALQGDVHVAMAREAAERGDMDAALDHYRRAGDAYESAERLAGSDENVRLSQAERWIGVMAVDVSRGISPDAPLAEVIKESDAAIVVNPDASGGYSKKSNAYRRLGDFLIYHSSDDPRPVLRKGIESAEAAIAKDPRDVGAWLGAGDCLIRVGEYEMAHGLDSRATLGRAIESYRAAVQNDPGSPAAYHGMGYASWKLGDYRADHGDDPREAYGQALRAFRKAIDTAPGYVPSLIGAGNVHIVLGDYETARGLDSIPNYEEAVASYERALTVNPALVIAWSNLGLAHYYIGLRLVARGMNPEPSFKQAIQYCQKAVEIDPKYEFAHMNTGLAYLYSGDYEMSRGMDPRALLQQAVRCFRAAEEINPADPLVHANLGEALSVAATYEISVGGAPLPALREALKEFARSATLNPAYDGARWSWASAYNSIADYRLRQGLPPDGPLADAREQARRGLAINPHAHSCYLALSQSDLIEARWNLRRGRDPSRSIDSSFSTLKDAVRENPTEMTAYRMMAETHRWDAEWRARHHMPAAETIGEGLEQADKALQITPGDPQALAIKGALLLLRAHTGNDSATASRAAECLEQALRANGLLKQDYGDLLAVATEFGRPPQSGGR